HIFDVNCLDQNFYDYLFCPFAAAVSKCGHRVPVVIASLEYTDLAAALIAVRLDAEEVRVWKEINGIFTADPRKVKDARLLNILTSEEASKLTYCGSEVIHPFTMEQVIHAHIPIRITNVMNTHGSGTIIFPDQPSGTCTPNDRNAPLPSSKPQSFSHNFFAQIFGTLDRCGMAVDLISTSEVHISMALGANVI
ncbi:Aspartokinase, partial [Linnemannia exigua]